MIFTCGFVVSASGGDFVIEVAKLNSFSIHLNIGDPTSAALVKTNADKAGGSIFSFRFVTVIL